MAGGVPRPDPAVGAAGRARSGVGVIGAYALLAMSTQLLWLTFAAITPESARDLGVSQGAVGDLAVVNALMFVVLAIPAGRWLDRDYRATLAAGALFTALGAVVRALDPTSFAVVMAGQVIMSVGQPLVLTATTKIAARHVEPEHQTTAIGIASGAQFLGILVAVLTGAPLYDAGGLRAVLIANAAFSVVAAVAVQLSLRVPPLAEPPADTDRSMAWLRRDPVMWRMAGLLFVGFGSYNALATWLDSLMTDFGHPGAAGNLIAVMTLAGVVGAAVLPGFVGERDARRTHCLVATAALAAVALVLIVAHGVVVGAVLLAGLGFLLLGTLPVVLEWAEVHVGPARAGRATAFLLLAGNVGAVVVVLTVQVAIDHPQVALGVLAAWSLPGLAFALLLPRSTPTSAPAAV